MSEENEPLHLDIEKISEELKIRSEVYIKIVGSFARSLQGKMQNLNHALADHDVDQLRMVLHEIRGTSGNLRLDNVSQAESAMHAAVKAGDPPDRLWKLYESLRKEAERLLRYVSARELPPPTEE